MATSPTTGRFRVSTGEMLAGKYVVEAVLGEGGMGAVVRARHAALGSRVAIKLMHSELASDAEMRARFRAEAERVAQMQSEHIAMVLDVGELPNGVPYIVMEYVEGRDLASILHERGPLPVREAVDYLLQACEGIAEAHSRGIVHRDIKPANLLVARLRDGSTVVKVLDFGIAKKLPTAGANDGSRLTHANAIMGSPYYSAPEQLEAATLADERSDIWAIGVTLHELLTSQGPFDGLSQAAIMASIMTQPPIPLRKHRPDLPEDLEGIIERCLEKDPNRRFLRVVDLVERLVPHGTQESNTSWTRISAIPGQERRSRGAPPSPPLPSGAPPPARIATAPFSKPTTVQFPGSAPPPSPNTTAVQFPSGAPSPIPGGAVARHGLSKTGLILATLGSLLIIGVLVAVGAFVLSSMTPPVLPPPLPAPPEAPAVRRLVVPRDTPAKRPR